MDRRSLSTLAPGHLAVDACQGAVPALLPFLIARRGLSYGEASLLVLAATVASSVVQPVFGALSDRRPLPWLMPVGLVLAGAGIAVVGVLDSYGATFAAIVVSGAGVAAYHPEGSRHATYAAGPRRATGMSVFSVGGNAGFALGPALVTPLVLGFGLEGTLGLLALPLVAAGVVALTLPRLRASRVAAARTMPAGENRWGAFARLAAAVTLRSFVFFGLITFVPLYFVSELGTSEARGNAALTVMLIAGAIGTLMGGRLADRVGARAVFVGSMAVLPVGLVAFLLSGPLAATLVLAAIGAATIATFSVTVVIGQELLPGHLGVASGVTLGLSIGMGGVGAWLLGLLADATSVRLALELIVVLPLGALALALTLRPRQVAAPPALAGGLSRP